uniref:Heparan-sulfate 6-O-sulfotransferase n=1 Tax=Hirondellea gigas TaxID=1518452 RepID=A0A2P2I9S0_9CRUS
MPLVDSVCQTDDDLQSLLHSSHHTNSYLQQEGHDKTYALASRAQSAAAAASGPMSKRMKRCLYLLLLLTVFGLLGVLYFGYYCPESVCALTAAHDKPKFTWQKTIPVMDHMLLGMDQLGKPLSESRRSESNPSYSDVVARDFQFDISGHDVMVFLHIQKTGGTTFGRHLVRDLDLKRGCQCHSKIRKRCTCLRPGSHSSETWLFSRYSTGWQCGLHADWTELTACVDQTMDDIDDTNIRRTYFYITFLRDPVYRFLSEYRHVKRGATWKNTRLYCGGRRATEEEVRRCYSGEMWDNPSLQEFMDCPDNLAINRQTRMLADLVLVGCYNQSVMSKSKHDEMMLFSAKQNLNRMAFFGLTEEQKKSQYLFEEIFNLRFSMRFEQFNQTHTDSTLSKISPDKLQELKELNHLDVQLYEYAKLLLRYRFEKLSSQDQHFDQHFSNMGASNFSWEALENEP